MKIKYVNFILYLIAFISVSVLICEVRISEWGITAEPYVPCDKNNPDPVAFITNIAGFGVENGSVDQENPEVSIKVWPNGMRECREKYKKTAKFKAAFVGCSYTFGCGVRAQDTMVWSLNDKYPQAAFDNWGMSGYGPAQMYLRMEYLLSNDKYDLIVYNAIYDHMFRTYVMRSLGDVHIGQKFVPIPYANWNLFNRFKVHSVEDLRWPFESDLLTPAYLKRVFYGYKTAEYEKRYNQNSICGNKDFEGFAAAMECHAELINRMYELCRKHNTDFLVCVLEDLSNIRTDEPDAVTNNPGIRCELINADMPEGKAHNSENRVLNNAGFHPNKNVHKYWADRFSEWLDKKYGNRVK